MTTTAIVARDIPVIARREGVQLAEIEYQRYEELIADLQTDEWTRATVCTGWDPADITRHLLGALEMSISVRENFRQLRAGRKIQKAKGYDHFVHGVNELQVSERASMTPSEIVDTWRERAPKALTARRRFPPFLRPLPAVDFGPILGRRSLAYMVDRVLTRDPWMHRIDICRAVGRDPVLTPEHDGRLIADMVLDWATTHGHAFDLELTGAAGGHYVQGNDGERLTIDAIDWIWIVSGRGDGNHTGLLAKELPL